MAAVGLRLAQEALAGRRVGGQRRQHRLESDQALQLGVLGLEDDAHAAGAEDLEHAIRPEPAQFVGALRWGQNQGQRGRRRCAGRRQCVGLPGVGACSELRKRCVVELCGQFLVVVGKATFIFAQRQLGFAAAAQLVFRAEQVEDR